MTKLPRSFYLRPTLIVAKDLLGKHFIRIIKGKKLEGRIVEVEAYLGEKDPASHTYRGRTQRNEVMFKKGGHLYVYFTYGMHFCANVVTEAEGIGHAVLIRALEPVAGTETMMKNRRTTRQNDGGQAANETEKRMLTNGPAKLCQAFGIVRAHNGVDLTGDEIFITEGEPTQDMKILATTRVGIKNGREKKWRFYLAGSSFISKK